MSLSDGEASNSQINESELCNKIQKLMSNIKTFCQPKNDVSNSNMIITPDDSTKLSSNYSEISVNNDVSISSLSEEDLTITSKKYENQKDDDFDLDESINKSTLIPEKTLEKILTLEDLLVSVHYKLKNKDSNLDADSSSFVALQNEFKELKEKVKIGTKHHLAESEIIYIMNRLKVLFENVINLNKDDNVQTSFYKPKITPRSNIKKSNVVTKTASSLDDITKTITNEQNDIENNEANKLSVVAQEDSNDINPKTIEYKQRNFSPFILAKYDELKRMMNLSKHSKDKKTTAPPITSRFPFKSKELSYLNRSFFKSSGDLSKSVSDLYKENEYNRGYINIVDDSIDIVECDDNEFIHAQNVKSQNHISKSVSNIPRLINTNILKPSRLPILKKDTHIQIPNEKLSKISIMSEMVTNQVIGNLKRMGLVRKTKNCCCETTMTTFNPSITSNNRCKSDLMLNMTTKQKRNNHTKLYYKEDQMNKMCSLYLTKLDCSRIKKHSLNDNGLISFKNTRIYSLETLLKKKKYKIIYDDKDIEIYFESNNKGDVINESIDDRMEFKKLVSLIGNTFRVIHQLISCPITTFYTESTTNHDAANQKSIRNPQLVHIENVCSCKILIYQNRKDLNRCKLKPPNGFGKLSKLLEIHYDLRKGKPLGCINLLRHLVGCEMKIFRSSILLPGGYLKEMNSCSVSELVNMSNHNDGIVKKFQQKPPSIRINTINNINKFKNKSSIKSTNLTV